MSAPGFYGRDKAHSPTNYGYFVYVESGGVVDYDLLIKPPLPALHMDTKIWERTEDLRVHAFPSFPGPFPLCAPP